MAVASDPLALVRKLLTLADPARNPDQGEVENAFRRACSILRRERVSLLDALGTTTVTERVVTIEVPVSCAWCERFETRLLTVVDELLLCDVTEWELKFLSSIRGTVREGRRLSERQMDVLKEMAEEYGC